MTQRTRTISAILSAAVLWGAAAMAQPAPPAEVPHPKAPATRPAEEASADDAVVRFPHLRVHVDQGYIELDATVVQATYALEFVLAYGKDKAYESILSTQAAPSHLHAGLLMLGLAPGKPGYWRGMGEDAEFIPPRGAELRLELRWTDADGKEHRAEPADWLKPMDDSKTMPDPMRWVFLGSDILPTGQYAADVDLGVIAVANLPSAVIDVPFASEQAIEARTFDVDPDALPPDDTKVTVRITPVKDAANAPHARALLEINRFGQMRIDGKPIQLHELTDWALAFSKLHKHAQVVIRSSALAISAYGPLARVELRLGGVYEFEEETAPLFTPLLPRTAEQMQRSLTEWQTRFDHPYDQIRDPGEEVEDTLTEIRRQREEWRKLDALLAEYEQQLLAKQAAYRKQNPPRRDEDDSPPAPTTAPVEPSAE
jgi:hypothetical protein